jgi:hypothetical protein
MTKKELIKALELFEDDKVVICEDDNGMWDNIEEVINDSWAIRIIFGGGSPFTDER